MDHSLHGEDANVLREGIYKPPREDHYEEIHSSHPTIMKATNELGNNQQLHMFIFAIEVNVSS